MNTESQSAQTGGQAAGTGQSSSEYAEELFTQALALHRQGDNDSAAALYLKAISLCPEHAGVCFYLALLYRARGEAAGAAHWFERAQRLAPEAAVITYELGMTRYSLGEYLVAADELQKVLDLDESHWQAAYNLGNAQLAIGRPAEAVKAYGRAAQLNPQDADSHFNLGIACKRAGLLDEAVEAYLCAMELVPEDAEIHYNLGLVYKDLGCKDEAIDSLEIAVALRPDYGPAHGNLGVLYLDREKVGEAIACYRRLIELDHNAASARHILAALTGETTAVAPSSYIAELFDSFAGHFEERLLGDLEYRTPWELKTLLLAEPAACRFARVLDLGCGTGLVGDIFRELSGFMAGVDLSPQMLKAAAAKKVYDELILGELVDFLEQAKEPFDLIVAADVLIYVGELERIFSALGKGLAKGGRILFSTERMDDGDGYRLRPSGRYAHAAAYIKDLAVRYGFRLIARRAANIRKEKGAWIAGDLYLLGG